MTNGRIKAIISVGAILIVVLRLLFPQLHVDSVTIALLAFAILPWLSSIIKSAELPGGWKIEFQDVKAAGEKVTGIAIAEVAIETKPQGAVLGLDEGDPNIALVALRIEIERRLRALAGRKGIPPDQSLVRLNEQLRRAGVLEASQASGLADLIGAGNAAAHGAKVAPGVANWAARYGPEILRTLDEKVR